MALMTCWVQLIVCTPFGKIVKALGGLYKGKENIVLLVLEGTLDYSELFGIKL